MPFPLDLYGYDESLSIVDAVHLPSREKGQYKSSILGKYIVEIRPKKYSQELVAWIEKELAGLEHGKTAEKVAYRSYQDKVPFYIENGTAHLEDENGVEIREVVRNLITLHPINLIRSLFGGGEKITGMVDLRAMKLYVYTKDPSKIRDFYNCLNQVCNKVDIQRSADGYEKVFLDEPGEEAKVAMQKFPQDAPSSCAGCRNLKEYNAMLYCSGNWFHKEKGYCRKESEVKKRRESRRRKVMLKNELKGRQYGIV